LAKETGIAKLEVDRMMYELKQRGLVDTKLLLGTGGEKKKRWYITNKGREAITPTSDSEPDSPL
jgi:predicted ArsR family transcriptional regulator